MEWITRGRCSGPATFTNPQVEVHTSTQAGSQRHNRQTSPGASKARTTRFVDHVGSDEAPGLRPAMVDGFLSAPMCDVLCDRDVESLHLPKDWATSVRNAVLNVIGIVRIAMLVGREALIQEGDVKEARIHQLGSEIAMLREELRISGDRMQRIDPHRPAQYTAVERMAILELRAIRGWSKAETARRFFVTDDTIRAWLRRADDDLLVQTRTPVNRFPDFVRYAVQQIKLFCPTLGKVKIADKLARAGIHIGKTTVGRILKEKPANGPGPADDDPGKQCRIVSKYPGHTWHADLTAVPISGGFWTNWIPNAIWQRWPVCWWLLNVVDHFSRRSMGFAVFKCRLTSGSTVSYATSRRPM